MSGLEYEESNPGTEEFFFRELSMLRHTYPMRSNVAPILMLFVAVSKDVQYVSRAGLGQRWRDVSPSGDDPASKFSNHLHK